MSKIGIIPLKSGKQSTLTLYNGMRLFFKKRFRQEDEIRSVAVDEATPPEVSPTQPTNQANRPNQDTPEDIPPAPKKPTPKRKRTIIKPIKGVRVNPKVVFVAEKGTTVDFRLGCLILRTAAMINKLPALIVRELVIGPGVELHPRAAGYLLGADIPVSFLNGKGQLLGQLRGAIRHDVTARLAQYRLYDDPVRRLAFTRKLVLTKVGNACAVLQRYRKNHPEFDCRDAVKGMRRLMAQATGANTLESLRGFEGAAARLYFGVFGGMIHPDFPFSGRNRRPPTDPVNALLSYAYTYLCRELSSMAEALSLDPYLGYLHEPSLGRPALALDLVEALRPAVADRFVVAALNRRQFQPGDFSSPQPGDCAVYLNAEGRRKFFPAFETWLCACQSDLDEAVLSSPRGLAEREIEGFRKALIQGGIDAWQPYCFGLPVNPVSSSAVIGD
jgi:CRISPR-associated protein Cas1